MTGKGKRPRDTNQLAKWITDVATGQMEPPDELRGKNPAAVKRGKTGGLKGGKVRADKLSPERRRSIRRNQDSHDRIRNRPRQQHIRDKKRREALAKRFKNAKDSLKLVIVRDMWLTGFDVPCLHTMYVDKYMRSHGLMQAIATSAKNRANRQR